jgi:anti-sigma-K factor RskA
MHQLTQAAGLGPPAFSAIPFWRGFWIATAVILVVVAFVGVTISLVNRVEWQAAITVMDLSEGKDASSPFEDLVQANMHLRAIARSLRSIQASSSAGTSRGGSAR